MSSDDTNSVVYDDTEYVVGKTVLSNMGNFMGISPGVDFLVTDIESELSEEKLVLTPVDEPVPRRTISISVVTELIGNKLKMKNTSSEIQN